MLGILFLFFIGKYYYKLAEEYERNKWLFAFIGIAAYYAGTIVTGLIYGIIYFMMNPEASEESVDTIGLKLIVVVFGLLTCVALYFMLEKNWKKEKKVKKGDSIQEIGKDSNSEA